MTNARSTQAPTAGHDYRWRSAITSLVPLVAAFASLEETGIAKLHL